MKHIIFILFCPIFSNAQLNAFQAPVGYYLNDLEFKDSISLIEDDNQELIWMSYKKGDPFFFQIHDEGDTLLKVNTGLRNRLKSIETNLYTAHYKYTISGRLKKVKNKFNDQGFELLGSEAGEFFTGTYEYKNGQLYKINIIATTYKRRKEIFMTYTLIYK